MKICLSIVCLLVILVSPGIYAAQDHNSTRSNRGAVIAETPVDKNKKLVPRQVSAQLKGRNPQTGKEIVPKPEKTDKKSQTSEAKLKNPEK